MIVLNETTPEVSLVSPGYPSRYPNSIHLQTEITSSVPQSNIVIEWTDFQLEAEGNCSFDRVTIAENVSRNYLTFALTMDCIRCQTLTLILFYTNESLTIFLLRLDYKYITLNKEYQDLASNNICSGRNQWSFFLILSIFPGGWVGALLLSWVARFIEFLKLFISHGVFFQTLTDLDSRYSIFLCGDKEKERPILEIKNRIEKIFLFISSITKR